MAPVPMLRHSRNPGRWLGGAGTPVRHCTRTHLPPAAPVRGLGAELS